MESTLKEYFGFSRFRPYQKEIVENILQGKDCLVVMATGSGKSLCYQVPPLIAKKTAVVISPLISLMQDQVMALKQRGIHAEYLSSAQTDPNVYRNAESGRYNLLYMTPEKARLLTSSFWSRLTDSGICLLAVDEAHCISEWGHDFRVEYKQLDQLRDVLHNVPFVALTATATEKVRSDILKTLKMDCPHVVIGSFDRPNLFYSVKSFNRGNAFLEELTTEISSCVQNGGSTIIYCTTIKDTEQISESLNKAGIASGIYNGQMSNKAREECHRSFIRDEFYVIVATIAFGMGIDKPNIRNVIHYGCPKSLESYYQESGRCGRDGVPSFCRLYYTRSDFAKADFYCAEASTRDQRKAILESLNAAQHYCLLTTCRRKALLEYFGEKLSTDNCVGLKALLQDKSLLDVIYAGTCDNCTSSKKETDVSTEAFLLIACIQACRGQWGLNLPVDVLRGSRSKKVVDANFDKLPLHGLGKDMPANWWKALGDQLISKGYLTENFKDTYRIVSVGPEGKKFLSSCRPDYQPPLYLILTPELEVDGATKYAVGHGVITSLGQLESESSQADGQLYRMLVEERMRLARQCGTAPYAICGDQTLRRIALARPSSRARLANIDGVNQYFLNTYGDHWLQIIKSLSKELDVSLDEEPTAEPSMARKIATVQNNKRIRPANFEAWKMWQEDGLTIQKIANHPSRAAPIKESTVMEYILEAAREGCSIDWGRFCPEIGLNQEIFKSILDAASKVGKEKLKPIKNQLPEEISYGMIKVCLCMEELGITVEVTTSSHQQDSPCRTEELQMEEDQSNLNSLLVDHKMQVEIDDFTSPSKHQKLNDSSQVDSSVTVVATNESLLNRLKNSDDGVSLSDLLKYFKGSEEKSVINILNHLEGEFLIFKKNNLYKLM